MAELELPPDHAPGTTSIPPGPPPEPVVPPFPEAKRRALEAKKITIDLMLLYTKNAVDHYIGKPAELLALVIDEANETFQRSALGNISLRLVHTQLIDYDEPGGQHFDHLYRFVDGVGPFADVRKLRNDKRADIVGLILDSPSGCGLSTRVGADSEDAFFIAHHSCAGNTYTIVHEIGARHDRSVDANEAPFAYAHGYVNGTKWRDIMIEPRGTRLRASLECSLQAIVDSCGARVDPRISPHPSQHRLVPLVPLSEGCRLPRKPKSSCF
jgi:hypothetical protein